jgi:hypothetical protein
MIGGFNGFGIAAVNLYNKDGSLMSPEEAALTAVHELLHTLRFEHPFEKTQGDDTKLIHNGGNSYSTTPTTDPNILFNIMSYSFVNINGQSAGNRPQNLLTHDQLSMLISEINLQKQGFGLMPTYDPNYSVEDNSKKFEKYYNDYWLNTPGQEVPIKK